MGEVDLEEEGKASEEEGLEDRGTATPSTHTLVQSFQTLSNAPLVRRRWEVGAGLPALVLVGGLA